jgi:exodeoxyribonuclease-5
MNLNKDQLQLIESLKTFWKDPSERVFLVAGQAGVGKTTTIRYFLDLLSDKKVALSAPTNKAVKVIKRATDNPKYTYATIYSLLGLTLQANGAVKELKSTGTDKVGDYDLVIIDEGSMLNDDVLSYLNKKTMLTGTKIIIIGDAEQLPPVKFDISPIWKKYQIGYELTEVMRHQNAILDFVQSIRGNPNPEFVSPGKEVIIHSEISFEEAIYSDADAGKFHDGSSKAIAWRNITVDALNQMIRDRVLGENKTDDPFVKGDRIIITEPIFIGSGRAKRVIASVDDEGIVDSFRYERHPNFPQFKSIGIFIKMDDRESIIKANVIHPDHKEALDEHLQTLAQKKLWGQFWDCKESFNSISYGYALTSHRSQGSTFERVYLEAWDVMVNPDDNTRIKCMYVAASRASHQLNIFV